MTNLKNILTELQRDRTRAQNEVSRLDEAMASIRRLLGRTELSHDGASRGRRRISAAGRRRIAAAQRARWAKLKAGTKKAKAHKLVRKITQATRNRMAKAQRARWKKVRQQQNAKKSAEVKQQAEKKSA